MACFFVVIFVLLVCTSGSPVHKNHKREKIVDSVVHTRKAGKEYNEKMELDPNKQTELFEVPAHAGVPDPSDTLNDFKPDAEDLQKKEEEGCHFTPFGPICF